MKERFLDVIKWALILIIAGAVFYVVCPKYEFKAERVMYLRYNKITGQIDCWVPGGNWERFKKESK